MKHTLLLSSACLLLGLAACDSITIIGGDSSADGEDVTGDVTGTSEETVEEVAITKEEADAYLAAVDEEEAAAWFEAISTYEVYQGIGDEFMFYQVDEAEDDIYVYGEYRYVWLSSTSTEDGGWKTTETVTHSYFVTYKNEEGSYTNYGVSTSPSFDEETAETSAEYTALYWAEFKESIGEFFAYDYIVGYYLPTGWEEIFDVEYALVGENLKLYAEFDDVAIEGEEDTYSGYGEIIVNPYGYVLSLDIDAEAGGEAYEARLSFVPDAEFERLTAEELRAMVLAEE